MSTATTAESTFRLALWTCVLEDTSPLTDVQRDWLQHRLDEGTAFTAREYQKLVPLLLAWSAGRSWEYALIEGLRGAVDAALLPSQKEERHA